MASDAPVRMGNGCCRLVVAGASAGGDGLVGGGARCSCAAAACSRRVDALFCGVPRCNARTRVVLQQQQSILVAVSVILVIDGCWAKALPGVMPVPAAVMSLGFTFLPGGAAADPLSQVPL